MEQEFIFLSTTDSTTLISPTEQTNQQLDSSFQGHLRQTSASQSLPPSQPAGSISHIAVYQVDSLDLLDQNLIRRHHPPSDTALQTPVRRPGLRNPFQRFWRCLYEPLHKPL